MNTAVAFQRARKPAEQELRRAAILRAAAELFDAEGEQGASLSAIAARAGFTKSNVYRYFESREEVLMSLFVSELAGFVASFETDMSDCTPGDLDTIARISADGFVSRPRFCALISILSSVLERNVSIEKVVALKQVVASENQRIANAMASRLPGATFEDCAWVATMGASMVAGMWPNVTPSPVAAKVLAMPEYAHLKPVPERDLARAIRALLASIA